MFLSTTPNINITKLFCELHSMLLLLPTAAILKGPPAAILEISVASEQRRGKLCHSVSIQSTYFVRQLSVENVRAFIFVSVTPLLLRWSLQYGRRWLQFPKNRCLIQSYFWDRCLVPLTCASARVMDWNTVPGSLECSKLASNLVPRLFARCSHEVTSCFLLEARCQAASCWKRGAKLFLLCMLCTQREGSLFHLKSSEGHINGECKVSG